MYGEPLTRGERKEVAQRLEVACKAWLALPQSSSCAPQVAFFVDRFRYLGDACGGTKLLNLDHVLQMRPYDDRRLLIVLEGSEEIVARRKASEELRRLVR